MQTMKLVHKWRVMYDSENNMIMRIYENDDNGCTCFDRYIDIPLLDVFLQVCALHY